MDGDLVYRALENLVQNAFRYAEPCTHHHLPGCRGERRDHAAHHQPGHRHPSRRICRSFSSRFYRGTRARREGGFGLGLSVVKSVVSSHGWDIAAASREGETSFTVTIPPGGAAADTAPNNKL